MSLIIKGLSGLPKFNSLKQDKIILCYISIKEDNTAELNFAGSVFPIKTLQKHGRLIDAEKLAVKIWTEGYFVNGNDCEIAVDFIQSAPTIIEAEVK